jgi:hypothetical protein
MSCVIFNSAAPADAKPLMAAITRQEQLELFMCSAARETSLDIASQHDQSSRTFFLDLTRKRSATAGESVLCLQLEVWKSG